MKKIAIFLIFILGCVLGLFIYNNYKKDIENNRLDKIEAIKAHYSLYVTTNKEANLYEKNDEEYKIIGSLSKGTVVSLSDIIIDENTKYFHINDLDYFIEVENVNPTTETIENDNYYKNYVVFNENIITNDITKFYDDNDNVYTVNKSYNLPIIIKDTDKYYVEIFNRLFYVKKEDVKEIIENNNSDIKTRNNIRTLAYHFVYKDGERCDNSYICHPESQFRSHIKYLSDNNYFALTMKDLKLFLEGKIQIPEKSIVLTLDDGYLIENAVEILEEYKIHATYFVVASWIDPSKINSTYVELQSHTNNMHNANKCPGGNQGSQLLCEDKDVILEDLKISREKLNGAFAFAYPFYDYNDRLIEILKETGFEMAFIGIHNTLGMSKPGTDLFRIPRLTLSSLTTMEDFIDTLR